MPYVLRRMVKGGNGIRSLADEWNERQLTNGLEAPASLLYTYADPTQGHDGGLYRGAGAVYLGTTKSGKLGFAWGLNEQIREALLMFVRKQ